MRPAGLRVVVAFAVVVAALGVGLASTSGSASAQAPPSGTITTQLQPGWNMIGWLGPDTSAGELFAAIPALNFIVAWDGGAQRYRWVWRASLGQQALLWIQGGRGLALHIGGEAAVEWRRPAAEGVVLLPLRAGNNLVTWGGLDGTPIEEALDWLGDAVVGASRWNADAGASERYRPGAPPSANTLRTLNHGDALWVQLTEDASWWQSGTERIEFVLEGDVRLTEEQESEYRRELAHVQAFFLERYGIEPPEFSVHFRLGSGHGASAGGGRINVFWPADDPPEGVPWSHEYFHLLQSAVRQGEQGARGSPAWLIEGSATYAAHLYSQARWKTTDKGYRWFLWRQSRGIAALGPVEDSERFRATGLRGYHLGALATDWLVRRAAGLSTDNIRFTREEASGLDAQTKFDSYIQYFRLLESSGTWQEAFEAAFGIAVDDFYEVFEEYRRGGFLPLPPHVSDDRDEPVLELMGEIPPSRAADIRMDFEALQSFFSDRLGAGPTDYTVYVAADGEAGISAYVNVFAEEPEEGGRVCNAQAPGIGVYVALGCYHLFAGNLATHHFYRVLTRLAPWHSVPVSSDAPTPWGPQWLQLAAIGYMTYAGQAAAGTHTIEQIRSGRATLAGSTTRPLSSLETAASVDTIASQVAEALSFLAADWLVQRAGEPSLFEYYRLLPSSGSWEDAFAAAFGIGVADFYEAFEAYRREAVTPLPHFADDSDDPVLVSIGEIPPAVTAALRADFEGLLTFFRERFGTGSADYTVYFAADRASGAGLVGFEVFGENSCGGWVPNVGLLRVLSCRHAGAASMRLLDGLAGFHFGAAASRLSAAPRGLPPEWLLLGGGIYAEAVHRADRSAVVAPTLGGFRLPQIRLAAETALPLGAFENATLGVGAPYDVVKALSFLAADWLAQRAGEPALFEYYRLRQTTDDWRDAFEGAFGITIDDFYAAFAEYRAAGFER